MTFNKDEVAKELEQRGAVNPCHRCGHNGFMILDGYTNLHMQDDFKQGGIVIGGPSVPLIHVACHNCGAVTSHAIGALGMLPKQEESNGE